MPRHEWQTVALPKDLKNKVEDAVEKNRYPTGKYHSISHWIVEAVKEKLEREEAKE